MLTKIFYHRITLPAATMLFLLISYQMAFKKTLTAWQLNRQFNRELTSAQELGTSPKLMLRKSKNLQRIIHQYRFDSTAYRSAIIEKISQIASAGKVEFHTVPQREAQLQSAKVQVERVVLSGSYTDLVRTLESLEQATGIGLVRAIRLGFPKQQTSNTRRLEMSVFLVAAKK